MLLTQPHGRASLRRVAAAQALAAVLLTSAATATAPLSELGQLLADTTPDGMLGVVDRASVGSRVGAIRLYGPEELVTMPGVTPLTLNARATSWLAVVRMKDPDSAMWFVLAPNARGVHVRYGVVRRHPPSFARRALDAVIRFARLGAESEEQRVLSAIRREFDARFATAAIRAEAGAPEPMEGYVTYSR